MSTARLSDGPTAEGRFLPVHLVKRWLDPTMADALLAYAIANEARFKTATVLYAGEHRVDRRLRQSGVLSDLGPFRQPLEDRALAIKPVLEQSVGMPAFTASQVEIELAAHGDGARFSRHIDTFVVFSRAKNPRVLTLVLYLNRRPRGFEGGAIRMYALGGTGTRDIHPDHNLLVAFPSIAPHSVEAVSCPGGGFADHRFAVNLWIHR